MALEDDILQHRFANEFQKLVVNVLFTSSWLHNLNSLRLKPFGVTPEQFNVLRILRGSHPKPLMLSGITDRMIDKSSNATRLVEKLRLKGWVKREVCADNRRQVDIFITAKGLDQLARMDKDIDAFHQSMRTITKAEATELNRILDKLRS